MAWTELDPIDRGDNETLIGQVLQYEGGPPRDITNDTLKFTVKAKLTDDTFLVQRTTSQGITKTNAALGQYSIALAWPDFQELTKSTTLLCDVEMTDISGRVTTLAKRKLPVERTVTGN